jgi:hypothetical protein
MTAYQIRLPWKERILHANQRLHWAEKNRRTQTVRAVVASYADLAKLPKGCDQVRVTLTWRPARRYRTDSDNLFPLLKAGLDGLVDYGLVPDDNSRHVESRCRIGEPAQPAHFLLDIEVLP